MDTQLAAYAPAAHACRPSDRSRCSECVLAYDCGRDHGIDCPQNEPRLHVIWPLVAVGLMALLAVLTRAAGA